MTAPLDFHPRVLDEIDDAHAWYEGLQPGLGGDFLDEVQIVLGAIAANPGRYGFAVSDIREAPLNRFPYAIYYRERRDRVRVLAVHHTARDPSAWVSRN